jgi:multidrug resistance efflux pump
MDNPELHVQRCELHSQLQQLKIQLQSSLGIDTLQSEQTQLQIDNAKQQLEHIDSQIQSLNLSAEVKGDFIPPVDSLKAGKFVRPGESLGSICRGPWIVRTMLTEDQWSSINSKRHQPIHVTLIGNTKSLLKGRIVSGAIAGTKKIEETALTHMGGGNIAVSSEMVATENFFDVVIEIDSKSIQELEHPIKVGMSSVVQFESEAETFGTLLVRRGLKLINQIRQASN